MMEKIYLSADSDETLGEREEMDGQLYMGGNIRARRGTSMRRMSR